MCASIGTIAGYPWMLSGGGFPMRLRFGPAHLRSVPVQLRPVPGNLRSVPV